MLTIPRNWCDSPLRVMDSYVATRWRKQLKSGKGVPRIPLQNVEPGVGWIGASVSEAYRWWNEEHKYGKEAQCSKDAQI